MTDVPGEPVPAKLAGLGLLPVTCRVKSEGTALPPSSFTTCLTTVRVAVATACTSVLANEKLSSPMGSGVVDDTDAVFCSVPAASGVTVIVTVASAPLASEPRSHVTMPRSSVQVP